MKSRILPRTSKNRVILLLAGFSSTACLFTVSADAGYVLAPIIVTLFIALLFYLTLRDRRGNIPLADLGTLTVISTVVYTIIPPLQFLLSGMEHTFLSARPLFVLAPTPEQFGAFTWWYVVYLFSFVIGYLVTDSKSRRECDNPIPPNRGTVRSFVLLFIILSVVMFAIDALYGINLYGVYDERLDVSAHKLSQMPLLFRQFYGIVGHTGIFFIVKLGLLLTIFLNWKKLAYRYALYAWLVSMLVRNVLWMGARTEFVLILMASAIMFHRFVRLLRLKTILLGGIILFVGFMIIGLMRGQATLGANLEQSMSIINSREFIFSINSEFQSLFGGNYDLLMMKQGGGLGEIPLQFMLYDLIMIIPQQILPFEKLNVQQWYMDRSNNPSYFMFNPIAQSIIGFGWVELILRGLFLGFVFAKARAWYIRRASSFWATLFYFYLIIISYYTIRGTAIYVMLVSILFRFIPLYFLVRLLTNRKRVMPKPMSVSSSIVDT